MKHREPKARITVDRHITYNDRKIDVVSVANTADELDSLEFHPHGTSGEIFSIFEYDDRPGMLYVAIEGEVELDLLQVAIEYAKEFFKQ